MESPKKIIGFTAGNFDLLHPGYIYTFETAKQHCDYFMVFLQRDPSETRFTKYKPVIPLYERYKTLMSIKYIDEVVTYQTEEDLVKLIEFYRPDVRILGDDYIGKRKPSSGTSSGGSICFCAALIVVLDIVFNILTSAKAFIAGDLP